ncbi:MAG: radical SAM family heme chaperone HemW [Alicyclobacillus sp.]|nr:radical SAM family heme chaperone HemW [Alicyclobacillus sp.]
MRVAERVQAIGGAAASELVDAFAERDPTSLYVHIPFCRSRCFYCDFTTYVAPRPEVDAYLNHLERELEMLGAKTRTSLQTVFVGGGTPTFLTTGQLDRLFQAIHHNFRLVSDAEVTVEANPGTVTPEKLERLAAAGVNRISFGAQTFDESLLLAIGRSHDRAAIEESVRLARESGFSRINLDLMFGLPDQTTDAVRRAVEACLALDVPHLSAYWLKVEPGTPFARWHDEGLLALPGEDAEAEMYELVRDLLATAGLRQYEVSNFARPGEEARHNLVYWRNEPYWAAGVGAHGYVRGRRTANVTSLVDYAKHVASGALPVAEVHDVSPAEAAEDTMMLGLRLREGVHVDTFRRRHGALPAELFPEALARLEAHGLVETTAGHVRLTHRAYPVANIVFEAFVGALTAPDDAAH